MPLLSSLQIAAMQYVTEKKTMAKIATCGPRDQMLAIRPPLISTPKTNADYLAT